MVVVREREVESYLRRRVEELGGECVKFIPDDMPGYPDRIVMLPGGVLAWAETKKPKGGRVSKLQKFRHEQLRKLGQDVFVVWTKEEADALVGMLEHRMEAERKQEEAILSAMRLWEQGAARE